MKKLLLAMAICASPVINITASADKMYTDLVGSIISNNKTTAQKLNSLNRIEEELTYTKKQLQTKLLNQYSFIGYPDSKMMDLFVGYLFGLGGTALIIGEKLGHIHNSSPTATYFTAIAFLSASTFFFYGNYAQTTICTKKIKEIDTVLAKLSTLKKELQKELYFGSN